MLTMINPVACKCSDILSLSILLNIVSLIHRPFNRCVTFNNFFFLFNIFNLTILTCYITHVTYYVLCLEHFIILTPKLPQLGLDLL